MSGGAAGPANMAPPIYGGVYMGLYSTPATSRYTHIHTNPHTTKAIQSRVVITDPSRRQ